MTSTTSDTIQCASCGKQVPYYARVERMAPNEGWPSEVAIILLCDRCDMDYIHINREMEW